MEFQVTSSSAATGKNDIVTRIYSPPPTLSYCTRATWRMMEVSMAKRRRM